MAAAVFWVSGLSFGITSGAFSLSSTLAGSAGPGTVGIHGDSPYFFITSVTFLTMALVLLHTFWGVIFFDACERRRPGGLGLVLGGHLLTSGLSFLNPWYEASLVPIFILTLMHRPLRLQHRRRLLPQPPQVPLL
uniref:Gamma-secretase subunit APH-1 n=1 Tax=Malurus cyaneus samueli TaxID=2593467 RepID=A0A8C5X337_9PASS